MMISIAAPAPAGFLLPLRNLTPQLVEGGAAPVGMRILSFNRTPPERPAHELNDEELLHLFRSDAPRAWPAFIDRHADFVIRVLRGMGFDHDDALDCFVYLCERLSADNFRRLRSVRHAGSEGSLEPWLRTVTKNLSTNWVWAQRGRRRLFRAIEDLSERQQQIFAIYFWEGKTPSEVRETLQSQTQTNVSLPEVLDELDVVFERLTASNCWRLMSNLMRQRAALSLDAPHPVTGQRYEPAGRSPDPERQLLEREKASQVRTALEGLPARDRLILLLRFEEALTVSEISKAVGLSASTIKSTIKKQLAAMKLEILATDATEDATC